MKINELKQADISIVLKLFGALFYYQPQDYQQANILELLENTQTPVAALSQLLTAFKQADMSALQFEHESLLAGTSEMPAPPWGSVYLDSESILFGDSTIRYRHFLQRCGFELNSNQEEPEDQLGLMLMVLGMLLEVSQNDDDEQTESMNQIALAKELLQAHLMSWFGFFISRFKNAVNTPAYLALALQTEALLTELCHRYQIEPSKHRDYFNANNSEG